MSVDDLVVAITLEDGREGTAHPSWLMEAVDTVEWRWTQFEAARTPLAQASALVELSNAMSDLRSWVPGFNSETGKIERPYDG